MLQSLKLQRALEQKYIPKVAADINAQFSQAADLIYSMTPQGLANNAALVIDKAPITKTVTALITEAGVRYAWLTGKDYGYGTKRVVEVKTRLWGFQFDEFMSAFVKNYLMQSLPGIIQSITQTTAKRIAATITDGLNSGQSVEMMAKRLQLQGDYSRERAITIVRTEAVSAQNALAIDNARRTGLMMNKKWLSNHDNKTRRLPRDQADHMAAHGQTVPLDENFIIATETGPVKLDYPGDKRTAPVEAWIKCRCTLRFKVVRDSRGLPIRVAESALRYAQ